MNPITILICGLIGAAPPMIVFVIFERWRQKRLTASAFSACGLTCVDRKACPCLSPGECFMRHEPSFEKRRTEATQAMFEQFSGSKYANNTEH